MQIKQFRNSCPAAHPGLEALRARLKRRRSAAAFRLQQVVKLASNENPLGVSPLALDARAESLAGMSRYPMAVLPLRASWPNFRSED